MLFNLHILPILGGFIFITFWNRTRVTATRYEGQRLIFNSAIWGFIFTSISTLILKIPLIGEILDKSIYNLFSPYSSEFKFFSIDALAFSLSIFVIPLNFIFSEEVEIKRAVISLGSQFERKITDALKSEKPVLIVLKNKKYYVANIAEGIDLTRDRTFFSIYPLKSGYQEADTLKHIEQIDYKKIYTDLLGEEFNMKGMKEISEAYDFTICLTADDVVSIRIYEEDFRKTFEDQQNKIESD